MLLITFVSSFGSVRERQTVRARVYEFRLNRPVGVYSNGE